MTQLPPNESTFVSRSMNAKGAESIYHDESKKEGEIQPDNVSNDKVE